MCDGVFIWVACGTLGLLPAHSALFTCTFARGMCVVCAPVFISHTVQLDTHGNVRDLRSGAMGAGKGGELDY